MRYLFALTAALLVAAFATAGNCAAPVGQQVQQYTAPAYYAQPQAVVVAPVVTVVQPAAIVVPSAPLAIVQPVQVVQKVQVQKVLQQKQTVRQFNQTLPPGKSPRPSVAQQKAAPIS